MAVSKATIKRWNDKFRSLSKAEKRVAIAKDVIANLLSKKYRAVSTYFRDRSRLPWDADIQKNFDTLKCDVCGVGSCLISLAKFENDITVEDLSGEQEAKAFLKLGKYFSPQQLHYIECVFEQSFGSRAEEDYKYKVTDRDDELLNKVVFSTWRDIKADKYYYNMSRKKRLITIMENIVRNAGTFRPLDF